MSKSLSESQSENIGLTEKIMTLSSLDDDKMIQWKRKQVAKKVTHTKEQYKRCIPQRRGLEYVEATSEKSMWPSASNSHNPKATSSEGTQAAYIDLKIVKLYEKLQSSTDHGIDFSKIKGQKPFRPGH